MFSNLNSYPRESLDGMTPYDKFVAEYLATGSASIVPKSDRLRENINIPDRKAAIPNSSTDKSQTRQNQSVKT